MYTVKQHIVLKFFFWVALCRSAFPFMQAVNGASAGLWSASSDYSTGM